MLLTTPHPNLKAEIKRWLASPDSSRRPLVVVGPPRTGKSTAIKAATRGKRNVVVLHGQSDLTGIPRNKRVIIESNCPIQRPAR